MSTHLKNGMTADNTGELVLWWLNIYLQEESQRAEEFGIFTVNKSVTADGSLLSPTGGVKGMYLAPHIHELFYDTQRLRNTAENIHDRFIRDKFFRKTMIELGRSEEIILEMDRLASEGHSHIATQEDIEVYRGNWCKGNVSCTSYSRTFGYGKLRTSSRTT